MELNSVLKGVLSDRAKCMLVSHRESASSPFIDSILSQLVHLNSVVVLCFERSPLYYKESLKTLGILRNLDKITFCDLSSADSSPEASTDKLFASVVNFIEQHRQCDALLIDDLAFLSHLGLDNGQLVSIIDLCLSLPGTVVVGSRLIDDNRDLERMIGVYRRRFAAVVDVRPLQSGFVRSIDGLLCVSVRESAFDTVAMHEYHFSVQYKSIELYAPGTSKLVS